MKTYKVQPVLKDKVWKYRVMNTKTGEEQSEWDNYGEAAVTALCLNQAVFKKVA